MNLFKKLFPAAFALLVFSVVAQTQLMTIFPKIGNPYQIAVSNVDSVTFRMGILSSSTNSSVASSSLINSSVVLSSQASSSLNISSSEASSSSSSSIANSSSVSNSSLTLSSSTISSSSVNLSSSALSSSSIHLSSSVTSSSSGNLSSSATSSSSGLSITQINPSEWRDISIYANIATPSTITDLYIEVRGDSITGIARFPLQWNSIGKYFTGLAHTPKSAITGTWKINLASSTLGLIADTTSINENLVIDTLTAFFAGTMTDPRDSKTYKTVKIGTQIWMAENLNYGTYISDANSATTLQAADQKFCYLNTESDCAKNGGLYQWHTALTLSSTCMNTTCDAQINSGAYQGICPSGWHLPKASDWDSLSIYLGGSTLAGAKMKLARTSSASWNSTIFNKENLSGFSAIPTGDRFNFSGFGNVGVGAYFWEATEASINNGIARTLSDASSELATQSFSKKNGFSVRCVKN
jgi:uncharacterized protein (TIGR02145 family)